MDESQPKPEHIRFFSRHCQYVFLEVALSLAYPSIPKSRSRDRLDKNELFVPAEIAQNPHQERESYRTGTKDHPPAGLERVVTVQAAKAIGNLRRGFN
jgi:hypothetical protein